MTTEELASALEPFRSTGLLALEDGDAEGMYAALYDGAVFDGPQGVTVRLWIEPERDKIVSVTEATTDGDRVHIVDQNGTGWTLRALTPEQHASLAQWFKER